MKIHIRNQKDVAAGLLYLAFGAAFSLGALNYKLGDPARMGPGWFPFWIGILLVIVGVITAASGMRTTAVRDDIKRLELGSLVWIIGAVLLFGLLLKPLGLVAALAVLVLVSSRASHEFTWASAIALATALIVFSCAVFVWGINLQLALWPTFLD
jgi:hypothetical protein